MVFKWVIGELICCDLIWLACRSSWSARPNKMDKLLASRRSSGSIKLKTHDYNLTLHGSLSPLASRWNLSQEPATLASRSRDRAIGWRMNLIACDGIRNTKYKPRELPANWTKETSAEAFVSFVCKSNKPERRSNALSPNRLAGRGPMDRPRAWTSGDSCAQWMDNRNRKLRLQLKLKYQPTADQIDAVYRVPLHPEAALPSI